VDVIHYFVHFLCILSAVFMVIVDSDTDSKPASAAATAADAAVDASQIHHLVSC